MAETDTGALPKVSFADKTEKPVELVAAKAPKPPKRNVGRPPKPKQAPEEQQKEKEKVDEASKIVAEGESSAAAAIPASSTEPQSYPVYLHFDPSVKPEPKLIDLATVEALELAQHRAEALEKEIAHLQLALQHMADDRVRQVQHQREQGAVAVHTAMIIGGVVGGVSAAGVLQLVKAFF